MIAGEKEEEDKDANDTRLIITRTGVYPFSSMLLYVVLLVGLHVSIAQRGGEVGIINLGKSIRNTFVIAKLISTFKHFNSEDEAVVNLR